MVSVESLKPVISYLRDASTEPGVWSDIMPFITDAFGGVGAACFAYNDKTTGIEWAYMSGSASAHTEKYVEHYAAHDLYLPVLLSSEDDDWTLMSECLPDEVLSYSEWYHDFVRPCGVNDIVGIQLHHAEGHRVLFGLHYDKIEAPSPTDASLHLLLKHLRTAAQIGYTQRTLNLKARLGTWALDHLSDALFLVYDGGRIIEMNDAAERILAGGHGLAVRNGRLVAIEAAENWQLSTLMSSMATTPATTDDASRRILLGRINARHWHLVTVFPLPDYRISTNEAAMVVRVVALAPCSSSNVDLGALFGLSPAEQRLAQGLMQGKTLLEMTAEFGLQMPTLRTQLRSILRKCGVQRQIDLLQVLLRAQ